MIRLSHQQHERLLSAIGQLHDCRLLGDFPALMNAVFSRLVDADSISYNEVYPAIDRTVTQLFPEPSGIEDFLVVWKQYAHQHPVIGYMRETGDGSAHQIADFLSRREYHRLELYQECYRKMGVEHQMAVTAAAPRDIVIGIALNRSGAKFSESDRLVLNAFRPHLVRAYLNLVELSHLQHLADGLAAALDDAAKAVILRSQRGVVLHVSGAARRLLEEHFRWQGGRALPAPVEHWVRMRLNAAGGAQEFVKHTAHGRLTASLSNRLHFHYSVITLHEERLSPDAERFLPLGLTPRECDVLAWLCAGKSNEEIGRILGLSPLTVKTHVQKILAKMGVENRTSAVSQALAFLSESRTRGVS